MSYPFDLELRVYILGHMLERVKSIHMDGDPFPHFWVQPFFPTNVYSDLLNRLPSSNHYEALKSIASAQVDGSSSIPGAGSPSSTLLCSQPADPGRSLQTCMAWRSLPHASPRYTAW